MKVVIDSNILFSALLRNSEIRQIILGTDIEFLFPEYIFEELEEHKDELMKKSGMSPKEFYELLHIITGRVLIVPTSVLIEYRDEAVEILKDIDMDDVLFVACVLAYPGSTLWSNDKALKKQNKVRVLNTIEMIEILKDV